MSKIAWLGSGPRNIALLFAWMSIPTGCQHAWTPGDLVGHYRMTGGNAKDVLVLRSDGRYVRLFAQPGEPLVTDTGRWQLKEERDGFRVVFTDFTARWRGSGVPDWPGEGAGLWDTYPQRTLFGSTRLVVMDDLGWYYVREKR